MGSWLAGLVGILTCVGVAFEKLCCAGPETSEGSIERIDGIDSGEERIDGIDSGTLRSLSFDLLGRPPYESERSKWIGESLEAYVDDCLEREELWSSWVDEQLYYFLLIDNFRPLSERILELPGKLHSGSLRVLDALRSIALCASFDRRNPGPDTFVTVVMEQFLGIEVQKRTADLEAGKRLYDGRQGSFLGSKGSSQSDVVRIALADQRTLTHFLAREHQRLLRSSAPKRDLSAWARAMRQGDRSFRQVLRSWLLSAAYLKRLSQRELMTNRIFVQALYVDLSDRKPEQDEARRLRNALDGLSSAGPLRSVIARLYLDSGRAKLLKKSEIVDPTRWVAALFRRLLGRAPDATELGVFVESFHDPACSPATVAYALISHPEYQTW